MQITLAEARRVELPNVDVIANLQKVTKRQQLAQRRFGQGCMTFGEQPKGGTD